MEAGGAEGGVAVGCGGPLPLFRMVRVCWVVLLRWGPSKACGPFVGVGVGVACQGLGPFDGGDPDALVSCTPARPPEDELHDGLVDAFYLGGEGPEGLDGEGGLALV